ncbi:hypothetical protein MLD38_015956 [Melastoma candidum]|uniref:Uncharacterized protein n=1 Tax=Melastoma candidum TaxID=119954 RepID=A0ACB9RM16_9MYRT|nr:hypothetical protein MLD38_015956 [Melastoma candidum]
MIPISIKRSGLMGTIHYEVLETLEFTSDRKKMSVVIKDNSTGKIFLLTKGADEAILPCADAGQQTRIFTEAFEQYSQLGLRTLCFAWRELMPDEYHEWSLVFKEANSTLVDREWRIAESCQRIEHDFKVLGVSAIEDHLQDGVPETIETLRKDGINFWMLTGDKQKTAVQIALSCNFISPEPKGQLLMIDGKTEDEVCRSLERVLLTMRITTSKPKDSYMGGPILSLGTIESQPRTVEREGTTLSIAQSKSRSPVHEPLLSDSPSSRRSLGAVGTFEFFQSQMRLSSVYSRNCKDN